MTERSTNLNGARSRLYPSRFSDRFYPLTSLRLQVQQVIKTYLSQKANLRLVDFGCGGMCYRPLFEPYVSEYIGVDFPENKLAHIHLLPGGTAPLSAQFADILLSTQVLEHVDSPSLYLQECNRILKPDGLLILSTHGYWRYHPHPNDYWRWTGSGLRKILNDEGFSILDLHGVMGLVSASMQLFQDAIGEKIPSFVRPVFAAGMQAIIELSDKLQSAGTKSEDACIFLAVACKKDGPPPLQSCH
jgi:SAM-dependent methyltransferase